MNLKVSIALVILVGACMIQAAEINDVRCTSPGTLIDRHQINTAILNICGGIAGAITKCQGNPRTTVGLFETARFDLRPIEDCQTINVSKGRFERGVRAALDQCGNAPFTGVIPLGTSNGDLMVELTKVQP